jgi:pyruvate dehydrogenase (quinone)
MPGKVKFEQAKAFMESFLRGQPHRLATVATIARDKYSQFKS